MLILIQFDRKLLGKTFFMFPISENNVCQTLSEQLCRITMQSKIIFKQIILPDNVIAAKIIARHFFKSTTICLRHSPF